MPRSLLLLLPAVFLAACADRERAEQYCKGILDTGSSCVDRQLTLYREQEKADERLEDLPRVEAESPTFGGPTPLGQGQSPERTDSLTQELVRQVQQSCEQKGGRFQKSEGGLGAGCVMGAP